MDQTFNRVPHFQDSQHWMLKLRKFLCGSFGVLAISFAMVGYSSVRVILANGSLSPPDPSFAATLPPFLVGVFPIVVAFLMLMPLPLAVLYGMAWWTSMTRKPAARAWALAASITVLILGAPPLALSTYLELSHSHGQLTEALISFAPLLLLSPGIAGVIAFAGKDALQPQTVGPSQPRIAGDGTHNLLDISFLILAGAGFLIAQGSWFRWAETNHLSFYGGLAFCTSFAGALMVNAAVHESGHALVGWALEMRLCTFIVGPFEWSIQSGRRKFKINFKKLFSFDGATGVVPTDPRQSRWDYVLMTAAGPIASLLAGLVTFALALSVPGTEFEWTWEFFAIVSSFALIHFVVNLIPVRPQSLYSDGAKIYQLLAGGPWADYHRAISNSGAGLVTPLRPRDYDIQAILRASAGIAQGRPGFVLRLLAYSHYHDCNQIPEACRALDEAESIYEQSPIDLPADACAILVVGKAFLAHDCRTARIWWERLQTKKIDLSASGLYWMAKCALEMSEGNLEAANESWDKGNAIVQQQPKAGAYDCNRDCFIELGEALHRNRSREFIATTEGWAVS